LLFGLFAIFALGAILLLRKQVVMVPAEGSEDDVPAQSKKAAKAAKKQAGVEAVKASVNANLDSLKEEVFRLELRKQAGTISEEDYAREKSRVEKLLRDLVRG
jgi:formiminotetrahydrofolate cyclodeaminase